MIFIILSIAILFSGAFAYYIFYLGPKLDPKNRAVEFIRQKRFQDAVVEYKKILDDKPSDFVTHYRLADIYMKMDETDQAALHLEKILEIDKYNYEVDKSDVHRRLAHICAVRSDIEGMFKYYYEIIRMFPGDSEALYHCAFLSLGQEEFDISQRYFDRLVKICENDFDVLFGAGMCSYQNQKTNDSVALFKQAVSLKPESEIANLAMILSLIKKRDFRPALGFAAKLTGLASDNQIRYIAMRCGAMLDLYLKKFDGGLTRFEEILDFARQNDMQDEVLLTLYDIGFACIKAELTKRAYDYWNELSSYQRNYNGIQEVIMTLRREMDSSNDSEKSSAGDSVNDLADDWLLNPYPANFLWGICSLRSDKRFQLRDYIVSTKVVSESDSEYTEMAYKKDLLEKFIALDTENFRIVANRVVGKLGFKVDQILPSYRESDGVDFMATKKDTKEKTFVEVRRWKKTKVGEIPLRNFAQTVNDHKAAIGLFITTAELTEEAQGTMDRLSKVKVVLPDELNTNLQGLL
ncbi:MAG: restriction endonuclease [Spirochaetota bacterium]